MKRLILLLTAGAAVTALLVPASASAAPVCTSVNKGAPSPAERKIVVSSCRDYSGPGHREYAVLYIGSASTRAAHCSLSLSTVEVAPNGAPLRWTPGHTQSCDSALRANRSVRFWGALEVAQYSNLGKTVACLFLDHRKLGSCVYSPALAHR